MLPVWREADCPQDPLRGWTLAVLGYGNQGRAQALNLRDSGHAVIVGGRPGGAGADLAAAEGFEVLSPERLAARADLIALLLPDQAHRESLALLARAAGTAARLKAVVVAHSFSLRFERPPLDPSWDVIVVAPAGPGEQLRGRFVAGGGLPALLAVHQEGSGEAWARGKAYAAAIGCARAGLIGTTSAQEAEVDLFGEQVVLCGGMNALCRAAFEVLVEAGYPEEMAYLECVQQLRLTAELVERHGIEGMRRRISPLALYGDLTRGPRVIDASTRQRLAGILEEIRSGAFAAEFLQRAEERSGQVEADLAPAGAPDLERAGRIIRGLYQAAPGEQGAV
jgi:ketol-acid reductoisomerase